MASKNPAAIIRLAYFNFFMRTIPMPDQLHTSLRQSPPVRLCKTMNNDQLRVFLCNFVLLLN